MHLLSFVDNHDVSRIASKLTNTKHLPLIYALMFAIPGIPCVYYGSEWGAEGVKLEGKPEYDIRASYDVPNSNKLTEWISQCAKVHKESKALCFGNYKSVLLTNKQFIFEREFDDQRVLIAINADDEPFIAHFNATAGCAKDLLTGKIHDFGSETKLPPYYAAYWEIF